MYGSLPGHAFAIKGADVAINRYLGQTWIGQPGQMGLEPVTAVRVDTGKPKMGMGHLGALKPEEKQAGICPAGISTLGIDQVSINQLQGSHTSEQITVTTSIPKFCRQDSPNKDKAIKDLTPEDKNPNKVIKVAFDDSEVVQEYLIQTSTKSSIVNLEEDIVKSLSGTEVVQISDEQCDTVVEKPEGTKDKTGPNKLNEDSEIPTTKFIDVINRAAEENPEENPEDMNVSQSKKEKNHVSPETFSREDTSVVTQISSTEVLLPVSDVTDLINMDKEREEKSAFLQGEESTSTSDCTSNVNDQTCDNTAQSVDRQITATLKEERKLTIAKGLEDRNSKVGSKPQSNKVADDGEKEQDKNPYPEEKSVSDLQTDQAITSDCIQVEDNMVEMSTVTSEVREQEQQFDSKDELTTALDEMFVTSPNEISTDTVNESKERSILDQKAISEQVDHSNGSTTMTNQDKKPRLISESPEIVTEVKVEGSNIQTISTLEQHLHTAIDNNSDYKEAVDDVQSIKSASVDQNPANADSGSIGSGGKEESILEERVSRQRFSTSSDQDEDTERQNALGVSFQMEDRLISDANITDEEEDDNVVEEMVSTVQNIRYLPDQKEEIEKHDASGTSSSVIANANIYIEEKGEETGGEAALTIPHLSISNDQHEEMEKDAESAISHSLSEDSIGEEVSITQHITSISDEQDENDGEKMHSILPQIHGNTVSDEIGSDKD